MTFDRIAPVYDWLARVAFGRSLVQAQQWGISQVRSDDRVIVLGGGTGETLPDLAVRQPAHVCYVDASAVMLQKARQRTWPGNVPITFLQGTEADIPADELADCVLLPFVLDLYPAATLQKQLLPALLRHLRPGGQLIVTDFDQPTTTGQRTWMWLMLRFFRLAAQIPVQSWTDWPAALRQAGLHERAGRSFRNGQVRTGCWVRKPD